MSRNRRRFARVRARGVAAHLRTPQGRMACQVENVSMGGLFVRTDRLEEVGTQIFVDLVKPGWKRQLTLDARVSSCVDALGGRFSSRMPGMGLQFLRLDEKQHDRLVALLRELGATDDDLGITLPGEHEEAELRVLELQLDAADEAPLPQPPPLREANLPPPSPAPEPGSDSARLMLQIRGLVMQLSEAQQLLSQRDHEIERLREEVAMLKSALVSSVRKL